MKFRALIASMIGTLALASCAVGDSRDAEGIPAEDWPNFGRTGAEQHYSPLGEISTANVDELGLAWSYDYEPSFTVSAPVAADGNIYTTTGHSLIRAFNGSTGDLLWEYDANTRELAQSALHMSWGNKGLSYYNGRIFIATTDGRVISLNADNGEPVWEQRQFELNEMRNANGPPRVFDGKVIVGHGGADISPIRGYVTAYDAMSGEQLWRFHTVPGDPSLPIENEAEAIMQPTWLGDWYGTGGGGTAWDSFSYDAELDLLYIGVGNGFPYNQDLRSPGGGDNLFLASIVAVDANTGDYVWHYQTCPAEQWDCTATQDMTIAMVEIDGEQRKVLMQAPKNGFFYVLDAATGEYISAEKIARVSWAERIDDNGRPVENPGIRYQGATEMFEMWPGPQGAHSWLPQAYSPETGLVYIPVIEDGALIGPGELAQLEISQGMGVALVPDAPLEGNLRSYLKAWNPVTQEEEWVHELPGGWPAGVMTTSGGLVFQGRIDGQFVAYDAVSGEELWSFTAQAPIVAPPISFGANGRQYIAVLTGNGSSGAGIQSAMVAGFDTDYRLPRRLLVFAIGADASLPDFTPPAPVPLADPDFRPDPAVAEAGGIAFATTGCMVCHGMNAVPGGAAPDLRYSPTILDQTVWRAIVRDGALTQNGMPPYEALPDETLEAIRHYLRVRAMQEAIGAAAEN